MRIRVDMRTPDQPTPLTTFVVKVASRCNLNCSYCYMYNLQDRTYRGQPAVMDPFITRAFARRVTNHSKRHHTWGAHIILHGGEPLLMGRRRLREWVSMVREYSEV